MPAPVVRDPLPRLQTPRLLLRRWEEEDAPLAKEAVDASLEHLRPWMPWSVVEPQTLDEKRALLRGMRDRFVAGEDFVYAILAPDGSRVLGGTGLHPRVGPRAFEIGYWIRPDATRAGLATEAAAAVTRVAFAWCRADRTEIRFEPENTPSRGIPRRLGYREEALLRRRLEAADGTMRDVVVYSLFASEYRGSPASRMPVEAFDATGRAVPLEG